MTKSGVATLTEMLSTLIEMPNWRENSQNSKCVHFKNLDFAPSCDKNVSIAVRNEGWCLRDKKNYTNPTWKCCFQPSML